jgi:ENTH domain
MEMLSTLPLGVLQELSSNVVVIEKLGNFQYKDRNGKDFGENVRHRAKELSQLIMDPERIREERRKVQTDRQADKQESRCVVS